MNIQPSIEIRMKKMKQKDSSVSIAIFDLLIHHNFLMKLLFFLFFILKTFFNTNNLFMNILELTVVESDFFLQDLNPFKLIILQLQSIPTNSAYFRTNMNG